MQIQAVSAASVYAFSNLTAVANRQRQVENAKKASPAQASPSVAKGKPASSPTEATPTSKPEDSGVLRLLEEGHFKGVADARLRINFFDELSARATEKQAATASEGTDTLLTNVGDNLETLTGSLTLTEDQSKAIASAQEAFSTSVKAAMEDFQKAASPDTASLRTAYTSAFDSFVQALQGTLQPATPPPADEGETTTPPAETDGTTPAEATGAAEETTTPPDISTAIADFASNFTSSLDKLMGSLEAAVKLPDPAPYDGPGKAYAKFAAIYDQMRSGGTSAQPEPEPAVDTLA